MIAKIVVAAAVYAIDKPYDYLIPEQLEPVCVPGVRVVVPFGQGNKRTEGFVLELAENSSAKLKPVESVLDRSPVMDENMIRLAAFMRERYFCTFFSAIRAMLPAGLWFKEKEYVTLTASGLSEGAEDKLGASPEAKELLSLLKALGGRGELPELKKLLDESTVETGLKRLKAKKMVLSEESLIRNVNDKTEMIASLAVPAEEAEDYAKTRKRAPQQKALLDMLVVLGSCSVKELRYFTGSSMTSVNALVKAGYVELSHREVFRRPEFSPVEAAETPRLNDEQTRVYHQLSAHLDKGDTSVSLLYGVTGSGKTMVYMQLISRALRQGKSALVLVPEIALTPQLMRTFMSRFGDQVAVLHSALQVGQRYDEWKRIRSGTARVIVGTRSAVFAPAKNLGLIILDEEHETTYKSQTNPRYHAREVAIWRGKREKAPVILGSATPSIGTMFLAKSGIYDYAELRRRFNGQKMPEVLFADMKQELKNGNSTSISSLLRQEIEYNLEKGEQVILYLNRRGASRTVICPSCGYVPGCERCSVSLTFHSANNRLMCHYCGFSLPAASACPKCGTGLRAVGTGTQRIEEEVHGLWPWVETIRMDADTVTASNPHEKILERFRTEKIPILIGTQMVTKGLNFPNVTLVGIIDGDGSLYTDDFYASENTFSKLTQVIGRAGRGEKAGRAVLQTMTPENQVLLQAAKQDYDAFYESELSLRQLQKCPPYQDVFEVHFFGIFESEVSQGALRFREALGELLTRPSFTGGSVSVMGPAPARVVKIMNRYHYQLTILAKNSRELRSILSTLLIWFKKEQINKNITASVDVNPIG